MILSQKIIYNTSHKQITNQNEYTMKKLLFLLLTFLFASCAKHEVFSDRSEVADVPSRSDLIFEATGCIPTDAESVNKFELLTDNQGIKYLFGSRNKDKKECF